MSFSKNKMLNMVLNMFLSIAIIFCTSFGMGLIQPAEALAEGVPALTAGTVTAAPGEVINVPINLTSSGEVVALEFKLSYDHSLLTYNQTTLGSGADGFTIFDYISGSNEAVGLYNMDNSPFPGGTDSTIALMQFTVSSTASSGASCVLGLNEVTLSDAQGDEITSKTVNNGQFSVSISGQEKTVTGVATLSAITVANGTTPANIGLPGTVQATLSDSTTQNIDVTWDGGTPEYSADTAGTYTFIGTLVNLPSGVTNPAGVTATVDVIVSDAGGVVLISIEITTPATKLTYEAGEPLDLSGLVVTGTYSDDSTKVETVTADNVTGFDSTLIATDQVLTINVGGKTTTYVVQIVEATAQTDYTYTVTDGQAQITGYSGSGGDVVIPGNLNGVPVTSIGYNAFSNHTSITSVSISQGVTSIGNSAFYGCSNLSSVSFPGSVAGMGSNVFSGCSSLTAINVSSDNQNYASEEGVLFNNPKTILVLYPFGKTDASYTVPVSVTGIGEKAFGSCSNLSSITIPGSVTGIGEFAFTDCSSLSSLTIPDSVTSIGNSAFYGCSSLSSVNIPEGVTVLNGTLFRNCTSLTTLTIPNSVTSIENSTFYGCSSLSSLTIPDSVTSIGSSVFRDCSSLSSLTIPDSVTSIGSSVFRDCTGLTTLTIPASVTSIGSSAFYGCSNLSLVNIPEGFTSIENSTFYGCSSLSSLTIPDSVTSIGSSVFRDCTGLTTLTIPASVTSIGNSLFDGCSNLSLVNIPEGITSIGTYAFRDCISLSSLTIPDSVTSIGGYTFDGCSSLTTLTIPASVTSIGSSAFANCISLSSLTIPGSVTSIKNFMFDGCSSLSSLTIPDSVTSIGMNAFSNCTSLSSLTIPASVTSIGRDAFLNSSNLTIYGYAESYAATYAAENSIPFLAISVILAADTTDNEVGQAVDITFTDDAAWRDAITDITVNGTSIAGKYTVSDGMITIAADVFTAAGDYEVVVKATGYSDVGVIQTINSTSVDTPKYTLSVVADSVYTPGTNEHGINTMTVNNGMSGLKYFAVGVTALISHEGSETVVFTHTRNGVQLSVNATRTDFDQVNSAQAGFNVLQGDVIKAFIVDDLTNAIDVNPVILQ